ncbi:MAG: ATP-binding protein [Acidobacteria bacterium]|nr:ATP-binding protein [Acidobacteriota bacterium]
MSRRSPALTGGSLTNWRRGASPDGRAIVFLGPPGVGKTHLAIGLGVMTAELGARVYSRPPLTSRNSCGAMTRTGSFAIQIARQPVSVSVCILSGAVGRESRKFWFRDWESLL